MKTTIVPDYYWILGLTPNATQKDINKAYRSLALRCHPLRNVQNKSEAETKFREISEAFEVLSNNDRRKSYDRHGRRELLEGDNVDIDGLNRPISMTSVKRAVSFRNPEDVFTDMFGSRDPATSKYSCAISRPSPSTACYDEHGFERSFPGIPQPKERLHSTDTAREPALFAGSVFSGPTDNSGYRTSVRSASAIDGHKIVTIRDIVDGNETVIVEEDGIIKLKTYNGEPCA